MIDFTPFRTTEEKLIALFLAVSPSLRQCEIIEILQIGRRHCGDHLRRLISLGLVESFTDRNQVFYKYTGHIEAPTRHIEAPTGRIEAPKAGSFPKDNEGRFSLFQ